MATVLQLVLGLGDGKLWQALVGVVDDVDDAEGKRGRGQDTIKRGGRAKETKNLGEVKEERAEEALDQKAKRWWPTKGYKKSHGEARRAGSQSKAGGGGPLFIILVNNSVGMLI